MIEDKEIQGGGFGTGKAMNAEEEQAWLEERAKRREAKKPGVEDKSVRGPKEKD